MPKNSFTALEYESMIFGRHLHAYTGRAGNSPGTLDQSAYVLLTLLQVEGPSSISELGQVTGLDASTLNRQTRALVTKGFAERIPDPGGGLARKFRASETGIALLDEERSASTRNLAGVLADWDEDEVDTFVAYLARMNRAVEERTGRRWPRPRQQRP